MAYDKFTVEKVFLDENINVICNKIKDALDVEFTAPVVDGVFGLTGTVAKIIQGDPLVPVKLVAFATSDDTLFYYLNFNIMSIIGATGKVLLIDRIQVTHPRLNLEFWKIDPLNLNLVTGLYVQTQLEIPAYIL